MVAAERVAVLDRIGRLERELLELRASLETKAAGAAALPRLEVLLLEAGDARVAIPVMSVVEVLPRVLLVSLPESAPWQAGYLRWRGEHVGVLDLGARWSGAPLPVRLEDRIVVLRHGGRLHGLLVAEVAGVECLVPEETGGLDPDTGFALALAARDGQTFVLVSLERLFGPVVDATA